MSKIMMLPIVALLVSASVVAAAPTGTGLTGSWAGDHVLVRTGEGGTVVQGVCTLGKMTDPVTIDAKGGFKTDGYFNPLKRSGIQLRDVAPSDRIALFAGQISGNRMTLTIKTGNAAPQTFRLVRDAKIKFAPCV